MTTDTVRPAAYAAFLAFDDTTTVLEVAETIAAAQRAANTVNATSPSGGVWGQLHAALLATLAIYFRDEHGENAVAARNAADAVLAAMYENGDTIAYNVRLAESHLYG